MKVDKLAISIFIIGMCFVIPFAAALMTLRLAIEVADSKCLKLGFLHPAREPMPVIEGDSRGDTYPVGNSVRSTRS